MAALNIVNKLLEATDPDDPASFMRHYRPKWRLISHVIGGHFFFQDEQQRVAVADYSMRKKNDPETSSAGLVLLDPTRPVIPRQGNQRLYALPVVQDLLKLQVIINQAEYDDLKPKITHLGLPLGPVDESETDDPQHYVNWLGQKEEAGELTNIQFGVYIITPSSVDLAEYALEQEIDLESQANLDQIERDLAILEANALQMLRQSGLIISDEGHNEDARVASVYIKDDERKLDTLRGILAAAEEPPSTTSGTIYTVFPEAANLYNNVSDLGRRLLDVTIEFGGISVLKEWARVNLIEALDPDDPQSFIQSYVPVLNGQLRIAFKEIQPHFPDAPENWYRNVNGVDLFQFQRADKMRDLLKQMRDYNQVRARKAGIEQTTYIYRAPGVAEQPYVKTFLKKITTPSYVLNWAEKTNAPVYFIVPVEDFEAYLQKQFPALSPLTEADEDVDPRAYLDATTGWIDTLLNAGMVRLPDDPHGLETYFNNGREILSRHQLFKRYSGPEDAYAIHIYTEPPFWLSVDHIYSHRNTPLNVFYRVFEFEQADTEELITLFQALDTLLTQSVSQAKPDLRAVDKTIDNLHQKHYVAHKIRRAGPDYHPLDEAHAVAQAGATLMRRFDIEPPEIYESVDDPESYVRDLLNLKTLLHDLKNYGMSGQRVETWGRWLVIEGFIWNKRDLHPSQVSEYCHAQLARFCQAHGITVYHARLTDQRFFYLGLPKIQFDRESWEFVRPTPEPEAAQEYQGWLPEAKEAHSPDDPEINVERHLASLDIAALMERLGFHKQIPSWDCCDPEYHWWETFTRGIKWTVIATDTPNVYSVSGYKLRRLANLTLTDYETVESFQTHISELEAKLQEAWAKDWFAPVEEALDSQTLPRGFHFELHADEGWLGLHTRSGLQIGYLAWKPASPRLNTKIRTVELEHVEIDRHYQNRGLGEAMMREWARVIPKIYPDIRFVSTRTVTSQGIFRLTRKVFGPELKASGIETLPARSPQDWISTEQRGYGLFRLSPVKTTESVDDLDPKSEIMRLTANAPMRYNELRNWQPYIHIPNDRFHNPENYYFTTLIVPVFTATGQLSKAHSWKGWLRMKEFTYDNPPTWEQRVTAVKALVPHRLSGFFPDKLKKRGFQIGEPYEPYEGRFYTDIQETLPARSPAENLLETQLPPEDDPETFLRGMETDWRKILKKHGWQSSDTYLFTLEFPDRVWGPNWPVRIHAGHGWKDLPEFVYAHPDPENPDLDAEDAAYERWLQDHPAGRRDINLPDYIYFQFGREVYRRIEVPPDKLDLFCRQFLRAAQSVVGTETVEKQHAGMSLATMLWDKAKEIARHLQIPHVHESAELAEGVADPDDVEPVAYAFKTFNVPELLKQLGYTASSTDWHKVYRRHPRGDVMLSITRRGGAQTDDEHTLYDATMYFSPPTSKQWMAFGYSYDIKPTAMREKLRELEQGIQQNRVMNTNLPEAQESPVGLPPEDEPESVIRSHEKGMVLPELNRLGFTARRERGVEIIYGEEIPRWWYKAYPAADGQTHGIYVRFSGGEHPEVSAENWNFETHAWIQADFPPPGTVAQSQAGFCAVLRDLDGAMKQSAAENLAPQPEFEALKRALQPHQKWWQDQLGRAIAEQDTRPLNAHLQEAQIDLPPEDEPGEVMRSHAQGSILPELRRLEFYGRFNFVTIYGEHLLQGWHKEYPAANGQKHALFLVFFPVSPLPAVAVRNFNPTTDDWYVRGNDTLKAYVASGPQTAVLIRDLDAALRRSAAESLPVEQEYALLRHVLRHHAHLAALPENPA